MGWGDELIITGIAKRLQEKSPLPVVVFDRHARIRSHALWTRNPRIVYKWDRVSPVHRIENGPGLRGYIAAKMETRWTWRNYKCYPGEIYFDDEESLLADTFPQNAIVIEPSLKDKASPNKDWGRARWTELVRLLASRNIECVQLGQEGTQRIDGATLFITPTFRHACAALSRARAAVLPEGGLHHAAAAVGVRSVVIYGGFISPAQTGYDMHANLFTGGEPCGFRIPCAHCAQAMAAITPAQVMWKLLGILDA